MFLLQGLDGSIFYLLNNIEYTVGRKQCDLTISGDNSISRKHALIIVKNNKVTVKDFGSKYCTYINTLKLPPNEEFLLKNENEVRFGMLNSTYILKTTNLVITISGINGENKATLKNNINFLGGTLVPNWTPQCTHVTVLEIMLTVKVLCAVIQGIPIVNLEYWSDYVNCVKQNKKPPDVANYVPNCSELLLNENKSFDYKEERKKLFNNKVFIFPHSLEKGKMTDMIALAGGEAISWDSNPLATDQLDNSLEYIMLQTDNTSDVTVDDNYRRFVSFYIKSGKRMIPFQEIALAIINCSCEKDCNPNFDRKGTVFNTILTQTQTNKYSENILVPSTQTQSLISTEIKTELIIPHSFEDLNVDNRNETEVLNLETKAVITDTQNKMEIIDEEIKIDIIEESIQPPIEDSPKISPKTNLTGTKSIKRSNESVDEVDYIKRYKGESNPFLSKNFKQKKEVASNFKTNIESTEQNIKPAKSRFAFKNTTLNNENEYSINNVVNPFSRKRRLVDNNDTPAFKKPSTTTLLMSLNSFGKNFKSTPKSSKGQILSTPFHENQNSLQIDISAIRVVNVSEENSFEWISKSNNHTYTSFKEENNVDEDILKYIESFKNSIIIEEDKDLLIKKTTNDITNNNDNSLTNNNINFKKFKKVQPLRIQTTIIPESAYCNVVCNDTSSAIGEVPPQVPSDDDDNDIIMDSELQIGGRRGRR